MDAKVDQDSRKCATCSKGQAEHGTPLKHCAKCRTVYYCSRECQKADWKKHKRSCATNAATAAATNATSPPTNDSNPNPISGVGGNNPSSSNTQPTDVLEKHITQPFTKLNSKTWLHDRPGADVFKLLVDAFRMRQDDDYTFDNDVDDDDDDGLYAGYTNSEPGFRRFLDLAAKRRGLLPSWWSPAKTQQCVRAGLEGMEWSNLGFAMEKHDVQEHYGESLMPMQLRMFAEQVYGDGPGGQSGAGMLRLQMMAESGRMPVRSHFDVGSLLGRG